MNIRKKVRWKCILFMTVTIIGIACVVLMGFILTKRMKINETLAGRYSVNGIDVSHYQGKVDWKRIEDQGIDFAFIKATEGSNHVDNRFAENWSSIKETDVMAGAYHFFSFDSEPEMQAQLFIDTVGGLYENLPPVVDVEYYGDKAVNKPEKESAVSSLSKMLKLLEEEYQVKPIIYTTYPVYFQYLKGNFDQYPLWIRNVYFEPTIELGQKWLFWQYSDTAVLSGYGVGGTEKFIDQNVFVGSYNELYSMMVYQEKADPIPEVTMTAKEGTASPGGVTLLLENGSDQTYMYGTSYRFQRLNEGRWETVELIVEEAVFHTVGIHLNGQEEKELVIDWTRLYGEVGSGQYRIIKTISSQESYGYWEDKTLCAEFFINE